MTSSTNLKLILGMGSTSIIGGTIGYYFFNNQEINSTEYLIPKRKISEQLDIIGYTVLNDESADKDWEEILAEYNKIENKQDIFLGSSIKSETKEQLKEKCKIVLGEDSLLRNNYELAKRWCVKGESITDILKRKNYTKIGSKSESNNKDKWREKISLLKALKDSQKNITINIVGNEESDIDALSQICTNLNLDTTKTYSNKEFENNLNKASDWCFYNS